MLFRHPTEVIPASPLLTRTTLLKNAPKDEVWDAIKELYAKTKHNDGYSRAAISLLNALVTQRRTHFVFTRDATRELVMQDKNWASYKALDQKKYPELCDYMQQEFCTVFAKGKGKYSAFGQELTNKVLLDYILSFGIDAAAQKEQTQLFIDKQSATKPDDNLASLDDIPMVGVEPETKTPVEPKKEPTKNFIKKQKPQVTPKESEPTKSPTEANKDAVPKDDAILNIPWFSEADRSPQGDPQKNAIVTFVRTLKYAPSPLCDAANISRYVDPAKLAKYDSYEAYAKAMVRHWKNEEGNPEAYLEWNQSYLQLLADFLLNDLHELAGWQKEKAGTIERLSDLKTQYDQAAPADRPPLEQEHSILDAKLTTYFSYPTQRIAKKG